MREHLHLPDALNGRVWLYRDPGCSPVRHHHAELELNLVVRGRGTYLVKNRRYGIARGDLIWLFPGQEHVLMEQSEDFAMWIAVFKRKAIRDVAKDPGARILLDLDPSGECCRRLGQRERRRLGECLAELSGTMERPALFNAGISYALVNAWCGFEGATQVPVRDLHPAVERAARLLTEVESGMSMHALAAHAGLSAERLSRLFKQQTGMSLVGFRNRQRVTRFLSLYGTGHRTTMLNAALDAGFGSYAQFFRVFRSVMGRTPLEYRRQH